MDFARIRTNILSGKGQDCTEGSILIGWPAHIPIIAEKPLNMQVSTLFLLLIRRSARKSAPRYGSRAAAGHGVRKGKMGVARGPTAGQGTAGRTRDLGRYGVASAARLTRFSPAAAGRHAGRRSVY